MAVNGEVKLVWGDGEHVFNIAPIGQVLELEEKCGAGIATILTRLRTSTFFVNDFRETLRLGLIGAGMEPPKAALLVKRYVDGRPWHESVLPAMAIISVAMVGVPGDEVGKAAKDTTMGKPTADRTASEPTPETAGLSDPPSTAPAPPSDSLQDRSTGSPSGSSPPVSTVTILPTAPNQS